MIPHIFLLDPGLLELLRDFCAQRGLSEDEAIQRILVRAFAKKKRNIMDGQTRLIQEAQYA